MLITNHKDKSWILRPAILNSKFHRLKTQVFPEMPCWWHFQLQADSLWDVDTHEKFCFIAFTWQRTKRGETQNVYILNIICQVKTGTVQPVYTGHTKLTKWRKHTDPQGEHLISGPLQSRGQNELPFRNSEFPPSGEAEIKAHTPLWRNKNKALPTKGY